jgi:hypothetical protein
VEAVSLPPVDPELNRQLIAERIGWPAGAIEACTALEADYPRWLVFWTRGDPPARPGPGFRAIGRTRAAGRVEAFAETAEGLRDALRVADPQLPEGLQYGG